MLEFAIFGISILAPAEGMCYLIKLQNRKSLQEMRSKGAIVSDQSYSDRVYLALPFPADEIYRSLRYKS